MYDRSFSLRETYPMSALESASLSTPSQFHRRKQDVYTISGVKCPPPTKPWNISAMGDLTQWNCILKVTGGRNSGRRSHPLTQHTIQQYRLSLRHITFPVRSNNRKYIYVPCADGIRARAVNWPIRDPDSEGVKFSDLWLAGWLTRFQSLSRRQPKRRVKLNVGKKKTRVLLRDWNITG